jgi:uracil-DNA glycosylase family 4
MPLLESPAVGSLSPDEIRERVLICESCSARKEATRCTPFWPRQTPSPIMMIGRNPGINEDKIGKPFVGRGGELFEKWLNAIGLERDQIWLTNLLKAYTTADRKPKKNEIGICWDLHLQHELAYCRPHLIVPLGAEAFESTTGLTRLSYRHGILYDRRPQLGAYVMGVIHPGSALRSAAFKDMMVEDARRLYPLLPLALSGRLLEDGPPEEYEPQ